MTKSVPPGQRFRSTFPRFGLSHFANRFPRNPDKLALKVGGQVEVPLELSPGLEKLPRVEQVSDFHCVTTWSCESLSWSGYRFRDFYQQLVVPEARPSSAAGLVLLRGQDGYQSSLPLEDLLAEDILLADHLNGTPLSMAHGAPLRLVAPAHYGYKSVKHLNRIDILEPGAKIRTAALPFMDHPRGRVHLEERGRVAPGWFYRFLYRPLVPPTEKKFAQALNNYKNKLAGK